MDLRNVKNLEGKMRICNILYMIGLLSSLASLFAAYIVIHLVSLGWGVFLCCLAVVFALVAGTAQVMESYLCAEDLYRITGRRPKKKTQDDSVKSFTKSFTRAYAETAGRKSMEDALRLGKELEDEVLNSRTNEEL